MADPIQVIQGDEKNIVVTVTGGVITSANDIKFVLQQGKSAAAIEFELKLSAGEISNDSATQFTITLTKSLTINLKPGKYEIQGQLVDSGALEKGIIYDPTYIVILKRLIFT